MSERVNNKENNSTFYWEWTYNDNDTMLWKQMFINAHDVYEMNYNKKQQQQIIH